ncbi:RNA polymerase sigma factor [Dyadobacter sandarakinus]|uniref:RNA polymerase sigma-70 factor n=1 Tax=Dyadobacter sandarakinus TaxID=2747268 RepID=A0ABX7I538_9BACT|nr:RNA polymerase sigma-70 factor [Dyadobacter sandarakinus]QRR01216.1 RNA polymerase sigma-70 factor [Dyadobacter sandarakinus]
MSKKAKFPEEDLAVLISNGSEDAFQQLYYTYFQRIYNYALRFIKAGELAEDIAQEVFIKIWERRDALAQVQHLKSYLYKTCKNMALNMLAKAARDTRLREQIIAAATTFHDDTEAGARQQEYENCLKEAITALPPRRRQIYELVKLEGKSYEEVAAELHISPGTVNDHIVKATRSVREFLLRRGI